MNRELELLTCTFDNGVKPCTATVYNLYPTLVLLGFLQFSEIPRTHTICWIRDYKTNQPISTLPQLTEKIQKNVSDLRISFFSYESVHGMKKVKKIACNSNFPVVDYKDKVPDLKVYTIWWYAEKPRIIESGINQNPEAVANLFHRVSTGYSRYYFRDYLNPESEKDKPCRYSSWAEDEGN